MSQKLEPNILPVRDLANEVSLPPRPVLYALSFPEAISPENQISQNSAAVANSSVETLAARGDFEKAEQVADSLQDPEQVVRAYRAIGRRMAERRHHRSREFFEHARDKSREIRDAHKRSREQNNLGLDMAEAHEDSRGAFLDARESARHIKDDYDRAGMQRDIGTNMSKAAKITADNSISSDLRNGSKDTFEEARVSAREIKDSNKRAEMMGSIAKAMESSGFDASDAYAEAARAYAQTDAMQCRQDNHTTEQAIHLAERGDYESAIREAKEIQDDYRRSTALQKIAKVMRLNGEKELAKEILIQAKVSC